MIAEAIKGLAETMRECREGKIFTPIEEFFSDSETFFSDIEEFFSI